MWRLSTFRQHELDALDQRRGLFVVTRNNTHNFVQQTARFNLIIVGDVVVLDEDERAFDPTFWRIVNL